MKWKVLALINFVWFSGYAGGRGLIFSSSPVENQIYTLQLNDGEVMVNQDFINSFEFTQSAINERWRNKYTIDLTNFLKCDIINLKNILNKIGTKLSTFQLEFQKFPLEEQAQLIKVIDFLIPKEKISTLESLVQYFATYAIQKKKTDLYKQDPILHFIVHQYYSNIDDAEQLGNWEPSLDQEENNSSKNKGD